MQKVIRLIHSVSWEEGPHRPWHWLLCCNLSLTGQRCSVHVTLEPSPQVPLRSFQTAGRAWGADVAEQKLRGPEKVQGGRWFFLTREAVACEGQCTGATPCRLSQASNEPQGQPVFPRRLSLSGLKQLEQLLLFQNQAAGWDAQGQIPIIPPSSFVTTKKNSVTSLRLPEHRNTVECYKLRNL